MLQVRCDLDGLYVRCLFYTDDIVLSVTGLQSVPDTFVATAEMLSLMCNCRLAVGKFVSFDLPPAKLDYFHIPCLEELSG